ncbi:MAG: aspartate--tRNA(Asn) ligase [bacterium]|nr:aspartate--tRNA(Asn) ligase [bacterium]
MLKRVLSVEINNMNGETVLLKGWVRTVRSVSSELKFIVLADLAGDAQVVLAGNLAKVPLNTEDVVEVTGLIQSTRSRTHPVELRAKSLNIISNADPLPFPINQANLSVGADLIDRFRALALRHPHFQQTFHLQHEVIAHFQDFFSAKGFMGVHTPKIVASGTEGGAELFTIDYFGSPAYLAQSPQFFKQMLVGAGFERVFEAGPVFRAEEHRTSRHINEFTSLDIELGFIEDVHILMDLEEEFLHSLIEKLQPRYSSAINLATLQPIPRLTLAEAVAILETKYNKASPVGNIDPEGERLICSWAEKNHGVPAAFLHSYPRSTRPFYALPNKNDAALTESFDLIFRGVEITTGGLRIHRHQEMVESIKGRSMDPVQFEFYLHAFRFGMPPHGGFAIGAERLTMQLLGLKNIREATIMPVL